MRNARLDESQARIKIAGRNINNLSYADHTTPMADTKEDEPFDEDDTVPVLKDTFSVVETNR